ncbi:MAG: DNA repair protein RadA [Candidatus Omnitrophica bacterium]|nr:DNA repair protein RadA [Candidatus Omnitrophota bacterium]
MREKNIFICRECGYHSVRWLGKCPACGEWNSFRIEQETESRKEFIFEPPKKLSEIEKDEAEKRTPTGISEFDRVLGGGVVSGSVILLAGEPGIGKSTLVLLIAGKTVSPGKKVLYVSGEESLSQLKIRAARLKLNDTADIYFLSNSEIEVIKKVMDDFKPQMLVIDSIQLVHNSELDYSYGSSFQIRENTHFFIEWAKTNGIPVFLIGHITKEGTIAGPKTLEHLVDVVVYFEGEQTSNLRILRTIKNRFGPTDEIGVFTMQESGLCEVPEASRLFLSSRKENVPGSTIFPSQEGKRTILVEIQSLVSPGYFNIPRRTFTGLDYNKVNLILAIMEKKYKMNLSSYDVYFNVSGGLKVNEPGVDLAIAIASISSFKDVPAPADSVFIGELSLTGEIRPVPYVSARVKESARLGFKKAFLPKTSDNLLLFGIETFQAEYLQDIVKILFPAVLK